MVLPWILPHLCILHHCTIAPLHHCTTAPLYHCTNLPFTYPFMLPIHDHYPCIYWSARTLNLWLSYHLLLSMVRPYMWPSRIPHILHRYVTPLINIINHQQSIQALLMYSRHHCFSFGLGLTKCPKLSSLSGISCTCLIYSTCLP